MRSVMVSPVTRTGTIRPGPQTKSTVFILFAGTLRCVLDEDAPNSLPMPAVTVPSSPPVVALAGYSSISSAASRV